MRKIYSLITILLPGIIIPVIPGLIEAQPCKSKYYSSNIQQNLKSDEVILEYSITDSSAFVYAITGDSTLLACQSLNSLFWMAHKSFRRKLKTADPKGFAIAGQILYLFLIKPVQDFISGKRRLIIKSDDQLSELPFEAIILPDDNCQIKKNSSIHYLIYDYEVIYRCNKVLWQEDVLETDDYTTVTTDDRQFAFIGFSPVFCNHPGLSTLPDSKHEIAEIGSLFRQRGLTSWLAYEQYSQKEYFKTVARKGKIVHLSTHYISEAPGNGGGFLFWGYDPSGSKEGRKKGILTIEEINSLQLQADLIVLNACASGIEKQNSGARKNSLPAIFLKAGARNILSTLWSVTDRLAGDFMVNFYSSWLSGKTYSQALREVKLQMINCPETSLPNIWAPYVLTAR
ncbi:MAG: CHAT domain-containing protein [Bacteroidota bacterium]